MSDEYEDDEDCFCDPYDNDCECEVEDEPDYYFDGEVVDDDY